MRKDFLKKGVVLGIIFLFLGAGIVPNISSKETSGDTLYVPTEYPTIRSAIIAANHEDTIEVLYGTYNENLTVNKTLNIVAKYEESRPIINVSSYEVGINVTAPNVRIEGFIINGSSVATDSPTIRAFSDRYSDASELVVDGNYFQTFDDKKGELALEIYCNIKPITFSNNIVMSFNKGVSVGDHSVATIIDNNFFVVTYDVFHAAHINKLDVYYGSIQDAVNIASNDDNVNVKSGTYYENIFINKSIKLIGEDKDKDNTIIDGKHNNGIVVKITGNGSVMQNLTIQNSGELDYGLMIRANNIDINYCRITNNSYGIQLNGKKASHIKITWCNISNNKYHGLNIMDVSTYNTIEKCIFSENGIGIITLDSHDNDILYSRLEKNRYAGVVLQGTSTYDCTLTGNTFQENGKFGLHCWGSGTNTINANSFKHNGVYQPLFEKPFRHFAFWCSKDQRVSNNYWNPRITILDDLVPFPIPFLIIGRQGNPARFILFPAFDWDRVPSTREYDILPTNIP